MSPQFEFGVTRPPLTANFLLWLLTDPWSEQWPALRQLLFERMKNH